MSPGARATRRALGDGLLAGAELASPPLVALPVPLHLPFDFAYRDVLVEQGREEELSPLLAGEHRRVERALEKRRREFRAGRHVARLALADLGLPPCSLPPDADGLPMFPPGVVGSVSHTGWSVTYAAAIVSCSVSQVALDVEEIQELGADVAARVAPAEEAHRLRSALGEERWGVTCFSAKEAVYKCVFPRFRTMLGFHEVELRVDGPGLLRARVLRPGWGPELTVRYAEWDGRLLCVAYPV